MSFVQIIEYRTSKPAEMEVVAEEWEKATEGKRKTRRRFLCQDRDDRERFFNVVFFGSYESAMENSALPETDALSKKLMSLPMVLPPSTTSMSSTIGNSVRVEGIDSRILSLLHNDLGRRQVIRAGSPVVVTVGPVGADGVAPCGAGEVGP